MRQPDATRTTSSAKNIAKVLPSIAPLTDPKRGDQLTSMSGIKASRLKKIKGKPKGIQTNSNDTTTNLFAVFCAKAAIALRIETQGKINQATDSSSPGGRRGQIARRTSRRSQHPNAPTAIFVGISQGRLAFSTIFR